VAVGLAGVLGLQQQPQVHRRQSRVLETVTHLDEGARRPREVVHVVLHVAVHRATGGPSRRCCSRPVAPTSQPCGTVMRTSYEP
jgi:hypothetical protein